MSEALTAGTKFKKPKHLVIKINNIIKQNIKHIKINEKKFLMYKILIF